MAAPAAHAPGRLTQEGIWVSAVRRRFAQPMPGLLLDRDGVLVRDVHYLHRRQDVELLPGAVALLRWAAAQGVPVSVVSNQSGIARGLFSWDDFVAVQEEISQRLAVEGASVDLVIACPFHPEHTKNWGKVQAHWRKPGPGMLEHAAELLNIDLGRSWLIGDSQSDIAAARAAGLAGAVALFPAKEADFPEGLPFTLYRAAEPGDAITLLQRHFP